MTPILSFLISSGFKKKEPRYVCLSVVKASLILEILITSESNRGTQIFFSVKSPGKRTPSRFPNRASMEREACLQGILHISQKPLLSGSPVKKPSLKFLFMESLAERCPTTTALLHSVLYSYGTVTLIL
jgi:hypothetical protein